MIGENGVPETPDWVPPRPVAKPKPLTVPANVILGSE